MQGKMWMERTVKTVKNKFCVYVLTFPNGKKYIGQTSQPPSRRWKNGNGYAECPAVFNAIKRHGWNNVRHAVLADHLTHEEANELETMTIAEMKTTEKAHGYNIQAGGTSGRAGLRNTLEHNRRIAEAKKKPVYGFDMETGEIAFSSKAYQRHRKKLVFAVRK